jgi:hypothetical protein
VSVDRILAISQLRVLAENTSVTRVFADLRIEIRIWGSTNCNGLSGAVLAEQSGKAYIVGDRGTELLTGASGRIVSNAELTRTFSGARGGDVYNTDARGADLGARNRIARGMEMTGRVAVSTSLRAAQERSRRVPSGG